MCGIIALVGNKTGTVEDVTMKGMLATLSLRGPDDMGFARFPSCAIGQTRLSIVDLVTGHQPMRDNTRPLTIVFNGEIYDYQELRKELAEKGHRFSTTSDTEVILKAYAEYGKECANRLDGMFAFAIWDDAASELFIARDKFGKKPLYYAYAPDGTLLMASEIKALFAAGIQGQVDFEAVDDYLALMYVPPWKSIYKNIHVLPPAHFGIYKEGFLTIKRYWELKAEPIDVPYDVAKKEVQRLFDDAVRKRMVADVEIGSLLSGGVDSTLVTAYAQKYATHPLKTFSVGYEDYINELPYAKAASEKIGTDHYTLEVRPDLAAELEKIIAYMDEPHSDSSDFPQAMISGLASTKVKVALSGDGADELFMGYGWYWKYEHLPKLARARNFLFSDRFSEHIKNISVFQESERRSLWKEAPAIKTSLSKQGLGGASRSGIRQINHFDLTTYLPGQLLSKVDRTSMMHSLEVRCPFLDYKLAEYVYNIPQEFKMDGESGKIILKDILSDIMPKEFVNRRKQGFGAPVKDWLRTESVEQFAKQTILKSESLSEIFKKEKMAGLIGDFYEKKDDHAQYKVWSLLCLALWFKLHKKNHE